MMILAWDQALYMIKTTKQKGNAMAFISKKLVLGIFFFLILIGFSSQIVRAEDPDVQPEKIDLDPFDVDPSEVDPEETKGLTPEEQHKLEIDTEEVFDQVPG